MRLRVNIWILEWRLFQISFFYLIRRFKFFEKIILVSILRFVSLSRKRGDEYETRFPILETRRLHSLWMGNEGGERWR